MKYIDPGINRKSKLINDSISHDGELLLPSLVEINESAICNRTCSFCPKSDPSYPNEKIFVSETLVDKLCSELSCLDFSGVLVFSGFCEPLLDKNIYNLIKIASGKLDKAKIEVVTNGDVLNAKNIRKLFDSGLTTLIISAYDGEYQIDHFNRIALEAGLDESKIFIRPRYLSQDQDFGITLNNRAGMMSGAEYQIKALSEPLIKMCNYPFYSFFMDYNGDVLLCAHDWGKRIIIGNIAETSFLNIWNGKKMNNIRQKLLKKDRGFSPCNLCDVDGTVMGKKHVEYWVDNMMDNL